MLDTLQNKSYICKVKQREKQRQKPRPFIFTDSTGAKLIRYSKLIRFMETTKLLDAAKYVREETLINGNQAAQLDGLVNAVMELTAHVDQYTAKIADRVTNGLNVERLQKWVESAKAKLAAAVESLREWLKAFKANRPNVAINLDDDATENILPNRIKFNATFSVDVNGKWAKDINAGTNTAKNIWNAAIYSAKEAAKIDGTNEIIITVHLNSLCIGMVIATKKDGKTTITEEVYKSAVNFLLKGMEEEKTYNTPETSTPENDTTMKENENTVQEYTANALNGRHDRSAWDKAVTAYALELVETLDNWDNQPGSVPELKGMLLNGASDWSAYSWGGSSLIYNDDIAERCCTPSELKRAKGKRGYVGSYANSREQWLDVQARALHQAANRVAKIAYEYFNA